MSGSGPGRIQAWGREALEHHRAGRLARAEALYRRILAADPANVDALLLLGDVERARGRAGEAVETCGRAVAVAPRDPRAHLALGAACQAAGRPEPAAEAYRRALALDARCVPALVGLGNLHGAAGRLDEAIGAFERALAVAPDHAGVNERLAGALALRGDLARAVRHYECAVAARPDDPALAGRLGTVLWQAGRLPEAEAHLKRAVAGRPDDPDLHNNLGLVLQKQGHAEDAVAAFRRATELNPGHHEALNNLGYVHLSLLEPEQAVEDFHRAVAARPDFAVGWHNLLFARSYLPELDPDACLAERADWGRRATAAAGPPPAPPAARRRGGTDPVRVGYLSPDFRFHPVGFFIEPVLAAHDRSRAWVACYANVAAPDAATERMRAQADAWTNVSGLSDAEVARRVREDGIDVLVDLAGHAGGTRLPVLAYRPAPVQAGYLGDPLTSGLEAVDYRLTDAWADPPGAERWYSEALVRIPGGFCCYRMPYDAPPVTPLPAGSTGAVTFGSLMNPAKINRRVIALWARVLQAVPDAHLLLFRHDFASAALRERFTAAFRAEGVDPERVTCEGRRGANREYLAVYDRIDVALDTFPFCGHTTTCEALWMGVPVVTLAGRLFAERMGVSLMNRVGLPELVAEDADGFVATARDLAADRGRLAALRAALRDRVAGSSLCDAAGFTRTLEDVYRDLRARGGRGGRGKGGAGRG